jgi:hypothetical protein
MAVIAGQRETSNVASTQRVIDLHKQILMLDPSAAPLTTFTKQYRGGLQRERAVDPKFTWHNDQARDEERSGQQRRRLRLGRDLRGRGQRAPLRRR